MSTKIVGILNITPDSFSDGGNFFSVEKAVEHALKLEQEGADIIDIGAQSTRPDAKIISWQEEWQRLEPVLVELKHKLKTSLISLDSFNFETIKRAISLIDWVNDVAGGSSKDILELVTKSDVKYVFMHSLSVPADKNKILASDIDVAEEILNWAHDKIKYFASMGISKDKLIFDPGVGFGKSAQQSWQLINQADSFKELEIPILIGHSRKSFLNSITDKDFANRDAETLEVSKDLITKNIDYLRVHAVKIHKDYLEG